MNLKQKVDIWVIPFKLLFWSKDPTSEDAEVSMAKFITRPLQEMPEIFITNLIMTSLQDTPNSL